MDGDINNCFCKGNRKDEREGVQALVSEGGKGESKSGFCVFVLFLFVLVMTYLF